MFPQQFQWGKYIVTFANDQLERHDYGRRRVGRPRLNWVERTLDVMWEQGVKKIYAGRHLGTLETAKPEHVTYLREFARQYLRQKSD